VAKEVYVKSLRNGFTAAEYEKMIFGTVFKLYAISSNQFQSGLYLCFFCQGMASSRIRWPIINNTNTETTGPSQGLYPHTTHRNNRPITGPLPTHNTNTEQPAHHRASTHTTQTQNNRPITGPLPTHNTNTETTGPSQGLYPHTTQTQKQPAYHRASTHTQHKHRTTGPSQGLYPHTTQTQNNPPHTWPLTNHKTNK
jgi:hypothetical protein